MLISVEATNFCQFKHFKLKLRNRGLVWLGGANADTAAANSNGAGKSNVFKAIGWAAYGQTVDGADGDEVIRAGEKSAETVLVVDGGWTITRTRRKGSIKLKLAREGVEISGDRKEIQARIDAILGMDWATFRHVVMYAQGDRRFIRPETTDSERKALLHEILRTSIYRGAHDEAKKQAAALRGELAQREAERDRARARAAEHDVPALEAAKAAWDTARKERVAEARDAAKEDQRRASELRKEAADTSKLERDVVELEATREKGRAAKRRLNELELAVETAERKLAYSSNPPSLVDLFVEARSNAREWREKLDQLQGERCPVCTSPFAKGEAAKHRAEVEAKVVETARVEAEAKAAKQEAERARDAAEEARLAARNELRSIRGRAEELSNAPVELERARSAKTRAREFLARAKDGLKLAKTIAAEANPHIEALKVAREKVAAAELAAAEAEVAIAELSVELGHWSFWTHGFGPSGLPSFVLDAIMPVLTERTNHYLETLADGDISVEFSTQRELKSGETRDQIGIAWTIEGVTAYPPSNGQWKKLEIATDLALMDVVAGATGARPPLLLIDEALDGLDAEGSARILDLLHGLRSERKTILVISHERDMSDVFERALRVEKRGGVSTLVQVA